MGPVRKLVLRFRSAFWERLHDGRFRDAAFFHNPGAHFPTFWTQLPLRAQLLRRRGNDASSAPVASIGTESVEYVTCVASVMVLTREPDGTIAAGDIRGSIHKVGAALQGAPSCNGWTFWHYRDKGRVVPIDNLRQKIRSQAAAGKETLQ